MSTDRTKIKVQQEGEYLTAEAASAGSIAGMSNAKIAIAAMHSRLQNALKTGSENAATNVAETQCGFVPFKSKISKIGISVTSNVASDNTDYTVVKFFGRFNGTSTLIGSWNTHGGGQGALTTAGPGVIATAAGGLVTNANGTMVENSGLTYTIEKYGAGKALGQYTVFSLWLEEV